MEAHVTAFNGVAIIFIVSQSLTDCVQNNTATAPSRQEYLNSHPYQFLNNNEEILLRIALVSALHYHNACPVDDAAARCMHAAECICALVFVRCRKLRQNDWDVLVELGHKEVACDRVT